MNFRVKHLEEVNESYFEHFGHAMSFAAHMLLGALACAIHAVLPFVFEKTGSSKVNVLHSRMVLNRSKLNERNNENQPFISTKQETMAD